MIDMDDCIGKQLGNYRLLQLLGQGGFADVYLSEHIHLHTQAAIKVLQLRLIENNVQNFLNEARTIAHLVHPYIIRVLDFGVQDNIPFLVMDYASKGTFRQRFLHGQQLPPMPLFPYIKQAAEALQYAHDNKLIHRDVKPENMLLGPNDEVLLSDFGFALIQSSNSRVSTETAGTAAYMAPEQLQGKPRPASDQYALGIIAYEWLTGSSPFQGTFFEIASQHMLAVPSSLRKKAPSLSPKIEDVVMTALAKDPDQRFPTVRDFALALEHACLSDLDDPLVPPSFPSRPITPNRASQQLSTNVSLVLAGEKNATSLAVQNPFRPLASAVFQSIQPNTITPHGGTAMNQSSFNGQTYLAPQASQNRSEDIRQPDNAMPFSESGIQMHAKSPEHKRAAQNLSQSGMQPFSEAQYSQNITPLMLQQYQNVSQSRPTSESFAEEISQNNQRQPISQPNSSLAGLPPLSAQQFSQPDHSSQLPPQYQQLTQAQPTSMPDISPSRTQQGSAPKQQLTQKQLGTEYDHWQRYPRQGASSSAIIFVVVMAIFIIGGGSGLIYWSNNQTSTIQTGQKDTNTVNLTTTTSLSPNANDIANATANAISNQNPYVPGPSTLVMDETLSSNNQRSQWQENAQSGCQFSSASYHVSAAPNLFTTCFATGTNYANFTYEIQMIFIKKAPKYSSGGIIFRSNNNQHQFYIFEVYASGRYIFQKCESMNSCTTLAGSSLDPPSPAYHIDQINTIAVVANQNIFTFYINQQAVSSQQTDNSSSPYTQGMIGVLAHGGLPPAPATEVAYSNIKIW